MIIYKHCSRHTSKQNKKPLPSWSLHSKWMVSSGGGNEMHNKPISEIYSSSDGKNIAKNSKEK